MSKIGSRQALFLSRKISTSSRKSNKPTNTTDTERASWERIYEKTHSPLVAGILKRL